MTAVTLQNLASRNESRQRSKTGLRTHDPRNWAKRVGPASRAQGAAFPDGSRSRKIRVGRALAESQFKVAGPAKQNHPSRNAASGCDAIFTREGAIRAMESAAISSPRRVELGRVSALSGWTLRFGYLAAEDSGGIRQLGPRQALSISRGNLKSGGKKGVAVIQPARQLSIAPITQLVPTSVVQASRGISAEAVQHLVESGKLLWVWNLNAKPQRREICELRFLWQELAAPLPANTTLADAIRMILGERRESWRGPEVAQMLLLSRPSIHRLCENHALSGTITNNVLWIQRAALERFLIERHYAAAN